MFGRATIRLGIGPHSSFSCFRCFFLFGIGSVRQIIEIKLAIRQLLGARKYSLSYCFQVVIHEALMLLEETSTAEVDSSSSTSSSAIIRRFVSAVSNTKSLAKPPYIVAQESFVKK